MAANFRRRGLWDCEKLVPGLKWRRWVTVALLGSRLGWAGKIDSPSEKSGFGTGMRARMHIRLLTAYFPPDIGSAAHLFHDIGSELAADGHRVSVITGFPTYHAKDMEKRKYGSRLIHHEVMDGMEVTRVRVPYVARDTPMGRAVWQVASALAFGVSALRSPRADVVLVYSPPLTLGLTAWAGRALTGTKFVLNIQDLFPQSAIDLNLLKHPLLIRVAEAVERFLYSRADYLTFHSVGNLDHALGKGALPEQSRVIHNCVQVDELAPPSGPERLKKELGLDGKFVIGFAGVMGYSQDLDVILDAARDLECIEDISFLLVGDGIEKDRLVAKADEMEIDNVVWMPMQPRELHPRILHASDVCITTLRADVKTPVVPSKILSAMAAGRPVIAALDPGGDAPGLLEEAGGGISVPPGDREALVGAIMELYLNRNWAEEMGKAGRRFAEEYCSPRAVAREYLSVFEEILS